MNSYAKLSWQASGEPFSDQFQDFYFSTDGGLEESEYVFIHHNQLKKRFSDIDFQSINIAETGFGTGLNFLVTAHYFLQYAPKQSHLNYTSVEKYPLNSSQLRQIYTLFQHTWPQLAEICLQLLAQYPKDCISKQYSFHLKLFEQRIHLHLLIGDASEQLENLFQQSYKSIDCWFLDGFSPAKNPQMWSSDLFTAIANLSHKDTSISTFTAAGFVRRGLIEVGFEMFKAPRLRKKRENLYGYKK